MRPLPPVFGEIGHSPVFKDFGAALAPCFVGDLESPEEEALIEVMIWEAPEVCPSHGYSPDRPGIAGEPPP